MANPLEPSHRNSLRRRLLLSLLPGLFLAVLLAATASYTLVTRPMRAAFDQSLADTALALIPYITMHNNRVSVQLPEEAEKILRSDEFETVSYAVFSGDGTYAAGDQQISPLLLQARAQMELPSLPSRDERSFHDLNFDGARVRVLVVPVRTDKLRATVVVAETTRKRKQRDLELVIGLLAPLGLLAVATAITVWWGTRRGLAPVHQLADQVRERSPINLSVIDEPRSVEELRPLVHALNDLLSRLDVAQDEQRRFIADAAHQLRTPLAGLSMLLELAAEDTGADRTARIAQARLAVNRAIHLAQQLLTLSAVQGDADSGDEFSLFELIELVHELAPGWAVRAELKEIDFSFALQPCSVRGQRTMIGEAIANLVENALLYSPTGTQILVSCGPIGADAGWYLDVADTGPGIAMHYRDRIFDRFYRPPGSSGTGSGLGLAIVLAVAQRNQLQVQLHEVVPHGLRVRLQFVPVPNSGLYGRP